MHLLRALIIEHHWAWRIYVQLLPSFYGFSCIAVRDAAAALRYASAHGIDLIVTGRDVKPFQRVSVFSLIAAGVFGKFTPTLVINRCAARQERNELPNQLHVVALPGRFGPKDLERALDLAFSDTERQDSSNSWLASTIRTRGQDR